MRHIDAFLNKITMYKVVLYGLLAMGLWAMIGSLLGFVPFTLLQLATSLVILVAVCYLSNWLFSRLLAIPTNNESMIITALILFFVLSPALGWSDVYWLALTGVLAMASKYALVYKKKHLFNPAAVAAVLAAAFGSGLSIWWVGSPFMLPVVLVIGGLITRKIHRFALVGTFVLVNLVLVLAQATASGIGLVSMFTEVILSWPLVFFATVMVTEPLTTPPTKRLQVIYGAIIGVAAAVPFHVFRFYSSPELALVLGNIFSFVVSPKQKLRLQLASKTQLSATIYDFAFTSPQKPVFTPGQYSEWTLPHENPDSRGNRRYFTVASSPQESVVRIGVRIGEGSSSFKKKLIDLQPGDTIMMSHCTGDFVLPKKLDTKLVFIAGGIGVTPFRSMIQDLLDRNEKRSITVLYANRTAEDIAYKELFEEAEKRLGIKVVHVVTEAPAGWQGRIGYVDAQAIQQEIPDYQGRTFYISGPQAMVSALEKNLKGMGVPRKQIKTDFFPGFV